MNRFVIVAEEDYDCYTVPVPHPLETEMTREEVLAELVELGELVRERWNDRNHPPYRRPIAVAGLPLDESSFLANVGPAIIKIPLVCTVDEWFEESKNVGR